jgi:hypothetical protein
MLHIITLNKVVVFIVSSVLVAFGSLALRKVKLGNLLGRCRPFRFLVVSASQEPTDSQTPT